MLLIKTVALLCSATAAMAANAVISGAMFMGEDTTDYSADPAEIFRDPNNHAGAAASILVYSAKSAEFSPATGEPKSLGQTLDQFVHKTATFPGFQAKDSMDEHLALNGSLMQFEQVIREKLDDPHMARAFRDLIPGYMEDESLTHWILSLIVVSKPEDSDTVMVKLARMSMTIQWDKDHMAYIPEQKAHLIVADHEVNQDFLSDNADKLAGVMKIVHVRDFMDFFASPKVPDHDEGFRRGFTSCFKTRPIFRNRQTIMSWFL
ncbi:hypothetical protein BG015_009035 [Linnemannia schmuckeri]|uniref:Uncharacterized protein n=1 Tax=Linnemannia schmuckeri TaxID=64567 RepID=A0A9P5RYT2_9FUNG|nr:hypothetical protein BG015_009035 [Linnemannia schmuckeri]